MISAMDALQGVKSGQSYTPPTPSFNSTGGGSSFTGGASNGSSGNGYYGSGSSTSPQPLKLATQTPTIANKNQDYGFFGNIGHALDQAPVLGGIRKALGTGDIGQTNPNNPHGQFFTGSLVNKALDLPRTIEYGIAGFDKGAQNVAMQQAGKSIDAPVKTLGESKLTFNPNTVLDRIKGGLGNVIPGIQNRTQFGAEKGDFNAGAYVSHNPLAQQGINFGLSLAAPTVPLEKVANLGGKVIKTGSDLATKIPAIESAVSKAGDVAHAAVDTAKNTPAIYNALEKIPGLEHFRNPEVGKIITDSQQTSGNRISGLFNTISDLSKGLSKEDRVAVGTSLEDPKAVVAPNIKAIADQVRTISDKVGQELVDLKVMSPDTFNKYKGQYMSHIIDTVQNSDNIKGTGGPLKFFMNSLKERKGVLGSEGQPDYIREFQYPAFKALAGEMNTAESTKALHQIADTAGQKVEKFENTPIGGGGPRVAADGSGLVSMQDLVPSKIAHQFKGMGVPQEVADYMKKAYGPNSDNVLEKIANKALNFWKLGKTIYSGPGYHARNIMSNIMLSDFSTGAGLPATLANYGKAVAAYLGKGATEDQKYLQELKDAGVINRQSINEGLKELKPSSFEQGQSKLQKVVQSPQKFQQATEETAKLGVYSYWRKQGMSIKDAANKAEEAIFSPYRIGQNERNLVKGAVPFYSFTRQALPFTAKTYLKSPGRLTKYDKFKTAVEGLSPEGAANNSLLPSSQKGEIRLPVKDKNGNYQYFDPTYIYPYGNFGDQSGGSLPFGLSANPLLTEAASQIYNKDLYFDQPIAKSSIPARANAQRAAHAFQTFAPNLMPTDAFGGVPTGQPGVNLTTRGGSKLYTAFTNQPDYAGRDRSKAQAVLDTLGLKSAPFDAKSQAKFNSIDQKASAKAITAEIRSTVKSNTLTPAQKREIVNQLQLQLQTAQ